MLMLGQVFVWLSTVVPIALACQSYDAATQTWNSGRRGIVMFPAGVETKQNIEVQLSGNVNSLHFDCLHSNGSSANTFYFLMNYWCMKSAQSRAYYTMQYGGNTIVDFVSIKIDGIELCDGSSTSAPLSGSCKDHISVNTQTPDYKQVSLFLRKDFGLNSDLLEIEFDHPVKRIRCWKVNIIEDQEKKSFKLKVKPWIMRKIRRGDHEEFRFNIRYERSSPTPNIISLHFNNLVCPKVPIATTQPPLVTLGGNTCGQYVKSIDEWPGGERAMLKLPVSSVLSTWKVTLGFDPPKLSSISLSAARLVPTDDCLLHFENFGYNKDIPSGEVLSLEYILNYDQNKEKPKLVYIELGNIVWSKNCGEQPVCPTTPMPTTTEEPSTTLRQTTQSPEVTTQSPPEVTTEQPEITTESPPEVTTQPPEVSTQSPPEVTTQPPEVTTQSPPEVTTQQPEVTTQGPPDVTTKQPEITTESPPEVTTQLLESTTQATSTPTQCQTKYDYKEVLYKSLLFYEAQRSGPLPASNRIPWRASSTTNDGYEVDKDLTGGYFDAGDFVKFTFPGAAAITLLAWGMVEYPDGYKFSGEYENGLEAIKWATDFFIKCHTGKNEFWGQVGNGVIDHAFWGRASDLDTTRPCYLLNEQNPGSDLVGEVAASLAASAIVFKDFNTIYSNELLQHAEELYNFANNYQRKYSDSIQDAKNFYNSWSGYRDELAWAAAWLYKATGMEKYLNDAEAHWNHNEMQKVVNEFSWDNKGAGVAILMAHLTNDQKYIQNSVDFCNRMRDGVPKTPQGMIYLHKWGSNRHAANVAFACMALSKYIDSADYVEFSRKQIHLLLGDAGRSYVVGFGSNPPQRPHHGGASCPDRPANCGWDDYHSSGPNPQVLNGALVGGPDENGFYEDKRSDYEKNEVAVDYNAGFQSAVAALSQLQSEGNCGSN